MLINHGVPEQLFAGSSNYEAVHLFSEKLANVGAEEKIALMKQMEAECFSLSDKVKSVNYCVLESSDNERLIANTKGLEKREKSNSAYVLLSVVVKDGAGFKSAMKFKMTKDFSDISPQALAKEAVDEALSYIGAASIDSKNYPIILKNRAAASLLQVFTPSISADNIHKGKSRLVDKIGEAIAAPSITLIDDPHRQDGMASRTFDGEGMATSKLTVVEKGVLKTYLHNLKTANKDRVQSTGHALRPSHKETITIAPTNMYIQPGGRTFEQLVEAEKEALIITDLQGLHSGANAVSGDFSLAANGYLVKNGKIERPVDQITVAGNFYTLLLQVEAVGDDLEFGSDSVGSPSLKIKELSIGGE